MAHFEHTLRGDLDAFIAHLDGAVLAGSATANLEGGADLRIDEARTVIRVYERFSAFGGNRVSLNISALSVGEEIAISAITSGGSTAVLWKVNTLGEDAFLDRAVEAITSYGR